jgi:hypothetical protein
VQRAANVRSYSLTVSVTYKWRPWSHRQRKRLFNTLMWSWIMLQSALAAASVLAAVGTKGASGTNTPSAFTAPGAFPTSMFTKYYNDPKQTASQVQPVIKDPVETVSETRPTCLTYFNAIFLARVWSTHSH